MKRWPWAMVFVMATALGAAELNEKDPNTWTAYGKNSFGWRYSDLRQINTIVYRLRLMSGSARRAD